MKNVDYTLTLNTLEMLMTLEIRIKTPNLTGTFDHKRCSDLIKNQQRVLTTP